jgi:hypothetical protein
MEQHLKTINDILSKEKEFLSNEELDIIGTNYDKLAELKYPGLNDLHTKIQNKIPKQEIQDTPDKEETIDFSAFEKDSGSVYNPAITVDLKTDSGDSIDYAYLCKLDDKALKAYVKKNLVIPNKSDTTKVKDEKNNKRRKIYAQVKRMKEEGDPNKKIEKKNIIENKQIEEEEINDTAIIIKDILESQQKLKINIYSLAQLKIKSRPELNQCLAEIMNQANKRDQNQPDVNVENYEVENLLKMITLAHYGIEFTGNLACKPLGYGPIFTGATHNLMSNDNNKEQFRKILPAFIKKHPEIKPFLSSDVMLIYVLFENMASTAIVNMARMKGISIEKTDVRLDGNNTPLITKKNIEEGMNIDEINNLLTPKNEKDEKKT